MNMKHPDVMGEALGRLKLPRVTADPKVIRLHCQTTPNIILEKLEKLKLDGMADALREQLEQPEYQDVSFIQRLSELLDREVEARETRKAYLRLKRAGLPYRARMAEIDYSKPRGLVKSLMLSLSTCAWILMHHNVVITGPAGVGKTFLASALAQQACSMGFSALYKRVPELVKELELARSRGRYHVILQQLARPSLLILDNLGLEPLHADQSRDLLELLDRRRGQQSLLAVSHLRTAQWPGRICGQPFSDSLQERLIPNAYQINLRGRSLRTASPDSSAIGLDTDY